MEVAINTLLILLYQILLFGSIGGLPFASISSLPSFETSEAASNEELSPAAHVANLVNTENLLSTFPGFQLSNNFQLFIGLPIGNTHYFLSQNPSLIAKNNNGTPSPDTSSTQLPTTLNIQPNTVSYIPVSEPSSSPIGITLAVAPAVTSSTSISNLSAAPLLNEDFKSDSLKRELRDTISSSFQEPCFSVTQQNLARLTSDCVSNLPSPVFPRMPLLPNTKPMFPCVKMPVNVFSSSEDFGESSDSIESESILSSPFRGSIITNVNPNPSLQNSLLCPQDNNPNMLLALNLLNKRVAMQNSGDNVSDVQSNTCSESSETITSNPLSTSVNNALFFTEIKDYIDSKQTLQSDRIANQANIETSLSPTQINRLNKNLINAQVPQNNIIASQISQYNVNCEDTISHGKDLKTEYENVLRIRNSVIPNMMSNIRAKSIPKTMARNNKVDTQGCPVLETISFQDNKPLIQNNNININPTNECESENNNNLGNTGSIPFNNVARIIKHNLNDNEPNGITVQNNNNQGCPLLTSIPVYSKESLLNKQLCQNNNINLAQSLKNSYANVNNNNQMNLNQNDQGCPQLLSIAQNSFNTMKNNVDYVSNQDFNCIDKQVQNEDCNCIQTSIPNDNLAQALKMVNRAKTTNLPSTINILPYGEALLDGKPMSNNFVAVEPVSCPAKLPTCTCSDSYSSNNFLTIRDISSMPFPATVNSFSCSTPLQASAPISTNVRLSSSPTITNIRPSVMNLTPSVPTISSVTNTEFPMGNLPVILSQEPSCNSNFQSMYTLFSKPNGISPIITPTFFPVQSLPQVSFVNNLPSSTISVTPSLSLPDSCYYPISNLPSTCNSYQPAISSSYPLVTTNLQANGLPGSSPAFPSLNNMVSSLTQNLISKLMSQSTSGAPLANLPPVNPFTPNLITGTSSVNSPFCLDFTEPANFIVSPLNLPALSLSNIPVACDEYLPPIYGPGMIPLSSFNPDLFCVGSNTAFDCGPFALSTTDAYYPYIS